MNIISRFTHFKYIYLLSLSAYKALLNRTAKDKNTTDEKSYIISLIYFIVVAAMEGETF